MQSYLSYAAIVAICVALIHSIMGEVLIFSRLRKQHIIPTLGYPVLKERHVRILWASWHGVSIFGIALAAVVWMFAYPVTGVEPKTFILLVIQIAMAVFAVLVLIATKGMHPGWFGLGLVALLIGLGLR